MEIDFSLYWLYIVLDGCVFRGWLGNGYFLMKRKPDIGHITIWSDQHFPFTDMGAHAAIYSFVEDWQPDYHVHIGDCLDLGGISRHTENDYIAQYEEPVEEGLIALGRHFNTLFDITPHSKIVWLWGNHEERLRRFIRKNPAWRGLLDNPLKLLKGFGYCDKANKIKLVILEDFEDEYKIGKMRFVHGFWTCKHVAAKHVEAYDDSIIFGHSHSMQMHVIQKQQPRAGYCVGHLTDKRARRYLKGAPSRWVTGFGHAQYLKSNGNYTMSLLPIVDGGFMFAGRYYHKSQWK